MKIVRPPCLAVLLFATLSCLSHDAIAQHSGYEVGAALNSTFLGEGDVYGRTFGVDGSRDVFSSWTGLALSASYQRAVNNDLRSAVRPGNWSDKQTYVADLAFFVEPLHFRTGQVGHRFRVKAGPSMQRRRGENARRLVFPALLEGRPERLEELAEIVAQSETLHLYAARLEGGDLLQKGTYALITQDRKGTEVGLLLELGYGVVYEQFVFGLNLSGRTYQDQYRVWNAGLSLGYQF